MKNISTLILILLLLLPKITIGQLFEGEKAETTRHEPKREPALVPQPKVDPRALFPGKRTDSQYRSVNSKKIPFSTFAKIYVDQKINEWQKKGEFEKTIVWEKRVTDETLIQKKEDLYEDAIDAYAESLNIRLGFGNEGTLSIGEYDADKEIFIIKSADFGNLEVPVPIEYAEDFKYRVCYSEPSNIIYFIISDELGLAEAAFLGKYKYENPLVKDRHKTKKEITDSIKHTENYPRILKQFPRPSNNFKTSGTVVVNVKINREGYVIEVFPEAQGTTTDDKKLLKLAGEAALKARFNSDPYAPEIQIKTITYNFELN